MKKLLITALCATVGFTANATQISVSNSTQNPGQYSTMAAAITAAATGDTLLVHPTATTYGSFTLSKKLVIIGGGFNVQKVNPFYTTLGNITLGAGADESKFYGCRISLVSDNPTLSGLEIDSLYFENVIMYNYFIFYYATATNLIIKNSVLDYVNLGSKINSSAALSNCIFEGSGISNSSGSLLVEYCIFQGNSHLAAVSGAVVQNCIFYDGAFGSVTLSTFNNCLSFNLTDNTLPPGSNIGSNNISGSDPLFVDNAINLVFGYNRDYHLQAGSPGKTAAIDGGEIGLYGTTSVFSLSGEPLNSPIVRDFTITNGAIPVNGNLNIDVTITKPLNE